MIGFIESFVICYYCYMALDTLREICKTYYNKVLQLEDQKYDVEYMVARKDMEASIFFFFFVNENLKKFSF